MPPHRPPITGFLADRRVHGHWCPRPELKIPILVDQPRRFMQTSFIIDTGADVTMMPLAFARHYNVVGRPANGEPDRITTGFSARLDGYWGNLRIKVSDQESSIICFFYNLIKVSNNKMSGERGDRRRSEEEDSDWWLKRFCHAILNFVPGKSAPVDSPLVLGRAGFVGLYSLIIQENWAGISDRCFLDIDGDDFG